MSGGTEHTCTVCLFLPHTTQTGQSDICPLPPGGEGCAGLGAVHTGRPHLRPGLRLHPVPHGTWPATLQGWVVHHTHAPPHTSVCVSVPFCAHIAVPWTPHTFLFHVILHCCVKWAQSSVLGHHRDHHRDRVN